LVSTTTIKTGDLSQPEKRTVPERPRMRRPDWLKIRPAAGPNVTELRQKLRELGLFTVCEEARCPNIGECWTEGTATVMIMGGLCTRGCRFCSVQTGNPKGFLDPNEPAHTADVVAAMNARYVVVTSVDRDDLDDGGAAHFAATIRAIRERTPQTLVEVLIGDLGGNEDALRTLVAAEPDMLAHNIETVRRLSRRVRDARANYERSLQVLARAKEMDPALPTKSSIMVGLGETEEEVYESMDDLRDVGVDALTVGQYLQPTPKHLKVEEFISPSVFKEYEHFGLLKGFRFVASGPLVRSSYKAGSFHRLAEMRRPNRIQN
jgi:lipoic acid synthetase